MNRLNMLTYGLRNSILTLTHRRLESTDHHNRSQYAIDLVSANKLLCRKCEMEIEVNTQYMCNKRGGPLQTKYYHPSCYERLLQ